MAFREGILYMWMDNKNCTLETSSGKFIRWADGVTRSTAAKAVEAVQETDWIDSGDGNKFYCAVLYEEI